MEEDTLRMKKALNIWKSKKGGIPIVSEAVTIVMDILPTPIKVALFILLFTVIAGVFIPAILSMIGYACVYDSGNIELYQVPLTNTFGKIGFETDEFFRGVVGLNDYQVPEDPFPNNDKNYYRIPPECFTTQTLNGTEYWGYTALCTNCSYTTNFWTYIVSFGAGRDGNTICQSDGYYDPLFRLATLQAKKICTQCTPPYPYYFNISNCQSRDSCFFTIENPAYAPFVLDTYIDVQYLAKLKELGGVKRAQDSDEFINIQCSSAGKPALFLYGIEIFNKSMWLILIIGSALVTVTWAWYGVVLR